jgi:hypothetical protein
MLFRETIAVYCETIRNARIHSVVKIQSSNVIKQMVHIELLGFKGQHMVYVSLSHCLTESESYVTTDGQPASLSWNKAPIWGLRPDLLYFWQLRVCWFGAPSLTRGRVCRLQFLLVLASAVIFWSESHRTRGHILLSQIWELPFCRLLRLAGSWWRYSTPPPHRGIAILGSRQSLTYPRISQHFMELESVLPCSQGPITGPCPESDESSLYHFILLL